MTRRTYQEMGIPVAPGGEWLFSELLFAEAALTIIVVLRRQTPFTAIRVFTRATLDAEYQELEAPSGMEIRGVVAVSEGDAAFLAVHDPASKGIALFRCELRSRLLVALPKLSFPGDYADYWISALHSVSGLGDRLIVTIAGWRPPNAGGSYQLAVVDLRSNEVTPITALPAMFA